MKFNKLNFARHVAGTKDLPNWCCTIIKVSVYTRGRVAATYPWDMYPQHFHVCANVMILSLLHVASMCTTQVLCRCSMSLRHVPATRSLVSPHLKVAGGGGGEDSSFNSMHLCKEYARSATTNTDNTRNMCERPFEIFVSVSLLALDSNHVARTSRVFKSASSLFL